LARALGVRPLLCVRGRPASADVALGLGCDVVNGTAFGLLRRLDVDVLIVDDPVESAAAAWIDAARRLGIAVASVHDLGIGCPDADLLIDGSVSRTIKSARRPVASGPRFAIVDPELLTAAAPEDRRKDVVVSLGGGPRARVACEIAGEIARRAPEVHVRVVGGFVSPRPSKVNGCRPRNVIWVGPSANLARELGRALVAVVGGGVSLYEACALGTPAVGVAVVRGQRPTVGGFVARGAALGRPRHRIVPRRVADDALALLEQKRLRQLIARRARRLIDGQGARRAAHAIARLVARS
jgi:spore coat polysaccharide biosynthesis predicted glycosyltransferase SpsG